MKVFVGWSGKRSEMLAQALHEWLPLLSESIVPWMSSIDIDKGTHWAAQLSQELESSDVGVVCVTPENITSPWLLFESGAIAKKFGASLVCTLIIGMQKSDIKGPLSQFQHTKLDEKTDMLKFLHTLNRKRTPQRSERDIALLFDTLWPQLKEKLDKIKYSQHSDQHTPQQLEQQLAYYRQQATEVELKVSPRSADLFFNDRLLGSSPRTIRVNRKAEINTVSAAAANHFDSHLVINEKHLDEKLISINLEHKLASLPPATGTADRDWQTHVPRWLRDRRRYPKNPVLTRAIVTYLCFIGEPDEAVAEAGVALELAPDWYMAHNAMGYALVAKGQVRQAIKYFETTAAMKPDNYLGHYNLAAVFSREGDYPKCIDNLKRILGSDAVLSTFGDAKQDIESDGDFDGIRTDDKFKAQFASVCDQIKEQLGTGR